MKKLVFYRRKNKENKLSKPMAEVKFGKIKHFESVGMVKKKENIDTTNITMYIWDSENNTIQKTKSPIFGRLVVVYYVEV